MAVAGNTTYRINNSFTLLNHPVKKGGFSYIGSTYYGNNTAHILYLSAKVLYSMQGFDSNH
jgi:hypothetical protein